MFCSVSFSGYLNRSPWTLRRFDHIVVCSKKGPPNNGYPGRGRRPRKKYSQDVEDDVDISLLYEANSVTEIPRGFVVDCNKHINRCIVESNLKEAQDVFDLMSEKGLDPNVVTYTTLMKGYSGMGDNQRVYKLFKDMEKNGVRPNEITFSTIIRACANNGDLQRALFLFDKMKHRYGLTPDDYICNSLLNVCASAMDVETAKEVFREMIATGIRNSVVTLGAMLNVYAECCNKDNARQYFKECSDVLEEMKTKGVKADIQAFSTLLKLCARGSLTMEALELLDNMRRECLIPNVVCYNTIMDGISKDEKLSDREVLALSTQLVDEMKETKVKPDDLSYNSQISIALRIKSLKKAIGLFNEMKRADVKPTAVTYGTMIKCREKLGDPSNGDAYLKPCLDLMTECAQVGIAMDSEGYTSLLSACANVANLETALEIWSKMMETRTRRDVFAYTAMISVCLSADEVDKAFDLLDEMKTSRVEPNEVTYKTFVARFRRKKDRYGAQRIYNKMKSLGVKPDKDILMMLKTLRVS